MNATGGAIAFVDAEDEEKHLGFYREDRFRQFETRTSRVASGEDHELVQMLRML